MNIQKGYKNFHTMIYFPVVTKLQNHQSLFNNNFPKTSFIVSCFIILCLKHLSCNYFFEIREMFFTQFDVLLSVRRTGLSICCQELSVYLFIIWVTYKISKIEFLFLFSPKLGKFVAKFTSEQLTFFSPPNLICQWILFSALNYDKAYFIFSLYTCLWKEKEKFVCLQRYFFQKLIRIFKSR